MISGMPAIISVDKNNNCKIVIENCTLYDLTLENDDIIRILEIKE